MSAPLTQAVSGAFDTLSHCMETYFGQPHDDNLSDDLSEAVMRSVIRNARRLVREPRNLSVRGELLWAAAMGENGLLKAGKTTDFQAHQIEHQLGAYTNCNHGMGLAVIHPVLYRHLYESAPERFARLPATSGTFQPGRTTKRRPAPGFGRWRISSPRSACPRISVRWALTARTFQSRRRIDKHLPRLL